MTIKIDLRTAIENALNFAKSELDNGRYENALDWLATTQKLFVNYVEDDGIDFANKISNYYRLYNNWKVVQ